MLAHIKTAANRKFIQPRLPISSRTAERYRSRQWYTPRYAEIQGRLMFPELSPPAERLHGPCK